MADKAEKIKKRKRPEDGPSKSNKRVAIEDEKQVKIHHHEADKWAPVIALTPGLTAAPSIPLQPYLKPRKNVSQKSGRTNDIAAKELLLNSSEHPKLDYTAREEELGGSDTLLRHYIGVYDPETGKLDVMEARKMVVRGSVRAQQAAEQDVVSTNMRELRNTLGETFGTKKAKKAIASVTENAISPEKSVRMLANGGQGIKLDSAAAAMLSTMAEATAGIATKEELAKAADEGKPRPKGNLNAGNVKDVYTIESLVGVETLKLVPVRQWQETIQAGKPIHGLKSRFVANRIDGFGSNTEKLKIFRYMDLLIGVYSSATPGRGGRTIPRREPLKELLGDIPEAVLEGIKRKFTEAGVMSKFKTNLMITHLCAFAMLVDNFEVDTWDLKEDLKLETREMSVYFQEIGAKISAFSKVDGKKKGLGSAAIAQRKIAKLKIPLEFPKVSQGRRR